MEIDTKVTMLAPPSLVLLVDLIFLRFQDFVGGEEGKKGDNISHLVVSYSFS